MWPNPVQPTGSASIRHAIAHANGHLDLVREEKRKQIKRWLESLIERFKGWNNTAEVQ